MKKLIVFLSFIAMLSCNSEVDYSPREIKWDRDICANCLMGLADQKYSAQAINKFGEVIWFDDLGCLVKYQLSEDWKKWGGEEAKMWIGDCESGEWLDVEKAQYRYGDKTPMGFGYGAVKEKVDTTFDFKVVSELILGGKTKREKYLKEYKMLDKK